MWRGLGHVGQDVRRVMNAFINLWNDYGGMSGASGHGPWRVAGAWGMICRARGARNHSSA